MEIKPVILVLGDISGYTRFIRFHRLSLIHAERIVTELLESVIAATGVPLVLYEILGDAVAFYAVDDGDESAPDLIFSHVEGFFEAFRGREAELVSECSMCRCDACLQVGRLRIKAVLHRGEAVFTSVRQFTKIAGSDVILAYRLLKNTVPSREYILVTEQFAARCPSARARELERRVEPVEGFGDVAVRVLNLDRTDANGSPRTFWQRLKMFGTLDGYYVKRLLGRRAPTYTNLPGAAVSVDDVAAQDSTAT